MNILTGNIKISNGLTGDYEAIYTIESVGNGQFIVNGTNGLYSVEPESFNKCMARVKCSCRDDVYTHEWQMDKLFMDSDYVNQGFKRSELIDDHYKKAAARLIKDGKLVLSPMHPKNAGVYISATC